MSSRVLGIISRAKNVDGEEMLELLANAYEALSRESGELGLIRRTKGYVSIRESDARIMIVGDIHGDFSTLEKIIRKDGWRLLEEGGILAFLGDYVDRGPEQAQVLAFLTELKLEFPEQIVLLRGNHEPPPRLLPYPHDFPMVLRQKFGEIGAKIYDVAFKLFQVLPHILSTENGIVAVHGGPPAKPYKLEELAEPPFKVLEQLLWNDPSPVNGTAPSPRGAGVLFGPDITQRFLSLNKKTFIVRSHEPCEGYRLDHNGKVLTIFSRLGPPYYNRKASYLVIRLDSRVEKIEDHVVTV